MKPDTKLILEVEDNKMTENYLPERILRLRVVAVKQWVAMKERIAARREKAKQP